MFPTLLASEQDGGKNQNGVQPDLDISFCHIFKTALQNSVIFAPKLSAKCFSINAEQDGDQNHDRSNRFGGKVKFYRLRNRTGHRLGRIGFR